MLLILQRKVKTAASTIGEITLNGNHECYSLELPVKDGLPSSAIPPGVFPVTLAPSPKFQLSNDPWVMKYADFIPHINNIPNRSTILIHWGNGPHDTDGCVLVGQTAGEDFIGASRAAFSALHAKIVQAIGLGQTVELDVRLVL